MRKKRTAGRTRTRDYRRASQIAVGLVEQLAKEEFAQAVSRFNEKMKTELPEPKLKQVWQQVTGQVGVFIEHTHVREGMISGHDVVHVTCRFERESLDVRVVFDDSRRIAGLFFMPATQAYEYLPPPYASPEAYAETEVSVRSGDWVLPGTLTIPVGDAPFPAVVLVHGSGPNDRDETVGPNKPFRDLAWGLAGRGVAVLRYDKRTNVYANEMAGKSFTVYEEVVEDAVSAVELLRNRPEIDAERVFVLGHSLGGMLVPRIGLEDTRIAGFVVMAGATRPLEDLILEQVTYIVNLDGSVSEEERQQLDDIARQVEEIKQLEPGATRIVLGAPIEYWLDLKGYEPASEAKLLERPILILQGERDYQVTMEDFDNWKRALAGADDVAFRSYPSLNHLFIAGSGRITPQEYDQAGHVDEEVIEHIAQWIHAH